MSITDDQKEILKLGTVHAWVFKASLWAAPLLAVWMVNKVLSHDTEIALLKLEVAMSRKANGVTQSVNVGQQESATVADDLDSARTWLTTEEVAKREGKDPRTILNYIAAGQIDPQPAQIGKAWHIAPDYRIVPKTAEIVGTAPP